MIYDLAVYIKQANKTNKCNFFKRYSWNKAKLREVSGINFTAK